jgi:hypothetical protein
MQVRIEKKQTTECEVGSSSDGDRDGDRYCVWSAAGEGIHSACRCDANAIHAFRSSAIVRIDSCRLYTKKGRVHTYIYQAEPRMSDTMSELESM